MKLTLAEALPLKKQMSKMLQDKLRERGQNAYVEFEKGDNVEEPLKTFEQYTDELNEIRNDYREIDLMLDQANIESTLDWEGAKLSVKEAIELAKQYRGEAQLLKSLSYSKPIEKVVSYRQENSSLYKKALFNPDELNKKSVQLDKRANRLSMAIEKANHLHSIDFNSATKYL